MTFGQWADAYRSYREIYNFKAKQMLYKDIEDELERRKLESEPIASLADL